jgi:hypothetical protein
LPTSTQRLRAAGPFLSLFAILAVTAVTSYSSSTTPGGATAVSSTPAATSAATKLTSFDQGDADKLAVAATRSLGKLDPNQLYPIDSGPYTPRARKSASGQPVLIGVAAPDGFVKTQASVSDLRGYNQRAAASGCDPTAISGVVAAGRSTGTTFIDVNLQPGVSQFSMQEWNAVDPPAAVRALTQMAKSCGQQLWNGEDGSDTYTVQSIQVLGGPALAIETLGTKNPHAENMLVAFSGPRMLAIDSKGHLQGQGGEPPLTTDVLALLASALLAPSGG